MNPLTLELLAWVARRPRTYAEAIESWRSNCPRHPVWDDALSDRLVEVRRHNGTEPPGVALTALGRSVLDDTGRAS